MEEVLSHTTKLNKVYEQVVNATSEAVIVCNEKNEIIKINKACEQITGYTLEEVLYKNPKLFSSKKNNHQTLAAIWKYLETQNFWIGELWNRHKNGEIYPIIIKIYKDIKTGYFYAIFSDIAMQQESKDELFHLAYHDALTDLPNRLKLKAQLEYVANNSKRNDLKFAVLYLDLDDFKSVNDTLGHGFGDELLILLANKFKNIVRTNDMVARLGGDEFIIVLSDISNYLFIERVCQKILSAVNKPFTIKDQEFQIGVSIGVSVYSDNSKDIEELIHFADSAMYSSKKAGKNGFKFYSKEMNNELLAHENFEKQMIRAIKNDEFILHYQPELDLSSQEVFSLEVLTRWAKDNTLLMPSNFMDNLEKSRFIFDFEELILKKACLQAKQWQEKNIYFGTISVNMASKHLEHGHILLSVKNALEESRLEAKYLLLEFNESDIMKISKKIQNILNELSSLGVGLSIDDFGSGFSSFNQLRECSISRLKIDKSYIDSLIEENSDEDIVKTIIALGRNMDIDVIAEGIEVPEQDEILKKNSCSKVQGYFYAKPMDSTNFEDWYETFYKKVKK